MLTQSNATATPLRPEAARALLPAHREQLRDSGLLDSTIDSAGLYSVSDENEARRLLGWLEGGACPPVPALAIPYLGEDFVRLRPDEPRPGQEGRPVKYESPRGQGGRIYVPPGVSVRVESSTGTLWLTEGEKKCLVGTQIGLAMVAAPGVWMFHDVQERKRSGDFVLHPELHPMVTAGRSVVVVPDSDIDSNPDVLAAFVQLVQMLQRAGAHPEICYLSGGSSREKVGLDDLFVARGCDGPTLLGELEKARRPAEPEALLDWIVDALKGWKSKKQALELRRACLLVKAQLEDTAWRLWFRQLAKRTKIPMRDLEGLAQRPSRSGGEDGTAEWHQAPGYRVSGPPNRGVFRLTETGAMKRIAPAPINVVAVGEDDAGSRFVTLRWSYGPDTKDHVLPRSELAGTSLVSLAERGAPVTVSKRGELQDFLMLQEQESLSKLRQERYFSRAGWSSDRQSFVAGFQVHGVQGVFVPGEGADRGYLDAFGQRGDEVAYFEKVRWAIGQSAIAECAWAAAHAAPLLRIFGQRSMLLSIWGGSRGGKSAAQALAVSSWGRPRPQMIGADSTATAVEGALARGRDLPLWIDDTQIARSKHLMEVLAYQVGAGRGRGRGTKEGKLRPLAEDRKSVV